MSKTFSSLIPSVIIAAAPVAIATLPTTVLAIQYLTVEQTLQIMFPGEKMEKSELTLSKEQIDQIETDANITVDEPSIELWRSTSGNVVFIDRVLGKHEYIQYAVGIKADGSVQQIEILEYLENYGGQIKDGWWRDQFKGKNPDSQLSLNSDIKNISGATISCRHVTEGVKRVLRTYEIALPKVPS